MRARSSETWSGELCVAQGPRRTSDGDAGVRSLWLTWSLNGLVKLSFAPHVDDAHRRARVPDEFAAPLSMYLSQRPVDFQHVPLDLEGTPFQKRVWRALRGIPYGACISYADLAREVGAPRATRAVGTANGRNPVPVIVPCHRVIRSDGALGGYSAGAGYKAWLLRLEGCSFPFSSGKGRC